MDFYKFLANGDSLDSIGVPYEEPANQNARERDKRNRRTQTRKATNKRDEQEVMRWENNNSNNNNINNEHNNVNMNMNYAEDYYRRSTPLIRTRRSRRANEVEANYIQPIRSPSPPLLEQLQLQQQNQQQRQKKQVSNNNNNNSNDNNNNILRNVKGNKNKNNRRNNDYFWNEVERFDWGILSMHDELSDPTTTGDFTSTTNTTNASSQRRNNNIYHNNNNQNQHHLNNGNEDSFTNRSRSENSLNSEVENYFNKGASRDGLDNYEDNVNGDNNIIMNYKNGRKSYGVEVNYKRSGNNINELLEKQEMEENKHNDEEEEQKLHHSRSFHRRHHSPGELRRREHVQDNAVVIEQFNEVNNKVYCEKHEWRNEDNNLMNNRVNRVLIHRDTNNNSNSYSYSPSSRLDTSHTSRLQDRERSSAAYNGLSSFTCSGHPMDVVRFLSCIPWQLPRNNKTLSSSNEIAGGGGGGGTGAAIIPPPEHGPFPADILNVILLYLDASSCRDINNVGLVCRFWHFYVNFAPHWSYFRRKRWAEEQFDLPHYIRAIVSKPKIVTRGEFIAERKKVEEYKWRNRFINTAMHWRWCVAIGILVAVMLAANYSIAYILGYLRTVLRKDIILGLTTFWVMVSMALGEIMIVIFPLASGGIQSYNSEDLDGIDHEVENNNNHHSVNNNSRQRQRERWERRSRARSNRRVIGEGRGTREQQHQWREDNDVNENINDSDGVVYSTSSNSGSNSNPNHVHQYNPPVHRVSSQSPHSHYLNHHNHNQNNNNNNNNNNSNSYSPRSTSSLSLHRDVHAAEHEMERSFSSSESKTRYMSKNATMHVLSWGLLLFTCSILFGVISALAFSRVQAADRVLDLPVLNFTMHAKCELYRNPEKEPSFALLPAPLDDLRWRPITLDETESELIPYCPLNFEPNPDPKVKSESNLSNNTTTTVRERVVNLNNHETDKFHNEQNKDNCAIMLFFDAYYNSSIFHNEEMLNHYKNIGNSTALGFDPLNINNYSLTSWCAKWNVPQVVAVSVLTYQHIQHARDARFSTNWQWLDESQRPSIFGEYSYRASSDINRANSENPPHSTEEWYGHSIAWSNYRIPLLSNIPQRREMFVYMHRHFVQYAYTVYVITSGMWLLMLCIQCIFKKAAVTLLGATTVVVVFLFNPIMLLLTGILCLKVKDDYFMCSAQSGGAMIGGGIALVLAVLIIYVSARAEKYNSQFKWRDAYLP